MRIRVTVVLCLLYFAPRTLVAQANMNEPVAATSEQYNVFMDPIYGYGSEENIVNFSSRNYWSEVAGKNPRDERAWFNYYRSTRYIAEGGAGFAELQADLDSIEHHLGKYAPGTWEQLIVEYWNSNRNPAKEPALLAAYALRADDPLTLRMMTGVHYLHNRMTQAYNSYLAWKNTGDTPLSTESYAYNVLQSLPADAVLFTNGELDTYPLIFQLQANKSPVKVISLAWCARQENMITLFQNAGLVVPHGSDSSDLDFFGRVAAANPGKKIYIAATCGPERLNSLSAHLYCTGLAYRYSETPLDHLVFLRNNVGIRMKLDGVGKAVRSTNHFDINYAAQLEMNYYLPLVMAADSYVTAGNPEKAKQLRGKAKSIRERAGYDEPLRNEGE